ncbi:Lrp/AsnC ligand binding domain-containing protein [Streptomyces sp. NPDC102467]|uniref:Lrp/AsnC ligand binding domain-containing protein n=1 Tax=Streptomyces sp. NPDC102467 TaxID=3366179 RepID=UPI0037F23503
MLLRCRPGSRARIAERLCAFEEAATIELTGPGSADLLLDVLAPDLPALTRFLTNRLEPLPGLVSVDCLFATSLSVEGSRWRLRSLAPTQLTALRATAAGSPEPTHTLEPDAVDRALLDALVGDGRLGLAALADHAGTSPATVRRRLRRLADSGVLTFRCDMAPVLAGRPVPVSFLARAPARDTATIHRTLAALPECRVVASVTGRANIFATLWLHDLADIQRRETALGARLPTLTVTDRIVGLHTVKRMGHLLDEDGRRVGLRAIRPW